MQIHLDMYQTLAIAVVVLMLGQFLKQKIHFLEKFCVPAPVVGGLLFAIFTCVCFYQPITGKGPTPPAKTACSSTLSAPQAFRSGEYRGSRAQGKTPFHQRFYWRRTVQGKTFFPL